MPFETEPETDTYVWEPTTRALACVCVVCICVTSVSIFDGIMFNKFEIICTSVCLLLLLLYTHRRRRRLLPPVGSAPLLMKYDSIACSCAQCERDHIVGMCRRCYVCVCARARAWINDTLTFHAEKICTTEKSGERERENVAQKWKSLTHFGRCRWRSSRSHARDSECNKYTHSHTHLPKENTFAHNRKIIRVYLAAGGGWGCKRVAGVTRTAQRNETFIYRTLRNN